MLEQEAIFYKKERLNSNYRDNMSQPWDLRYFFFYYRNYSAMDDIHENRLFIEVVKKGKGVYTNQRGIKNVTHTKTYIHESL